MVEIKQYYPNDEAVSIAEVTIGEEPVEVKFWGTYLKQLSTNEELVAYITALAQIKLGDVEGAKATLQNHASGENNETQETVEIDGRETTQTVGSDNRNWAKKLIDEN